MLLGDTGSYPGESFPNLQAPLLHTYPKLAIPKAAPIHSAGPLSPL